MTPTKPHCIVKRIVWETPPLVKANRGAAGTVVKLTVDPLFHEDSYGYRPGKSVKRANTMTRKRCWHYDWIVEFDITAASARSIRVPVSDLLAISFRAA